MYICIYVYMYIYYIQYLYIFILTIHRTAGKGRNYLLFLSTTSTRSQTFRHLFVTVRVRWRPNIFNHIACNCQAVIL